jgi:hypothetical protein
MRNRTSGRFRFFAALTFLCQAALLSQGCATGSSSPSRQVRTPQATVYFEEVADWSFEAAHPATVGEASIKQTLRGLYSDDKSFSHTSSADGSKPMRMFGDEDVEYLAPLLARALSQAQPEYVVAFRLSSSAGSGSEPTAGTLYVKDQELHVTLTTHRGTVSFIPESAAHRHKADPTVAFGRPDLITWAVDYGLLSKQPDQARAEATVAFTAKPDMKKPEQILTASAVAENGIVPDQAVGADSEMVARIEQELRDSQRTIARKDAKIDQLRRDLESMRRQLEAQDKELQQAKSKPAPINREKRGKAELAIR